ncbi:MAG: RidA family protein [Pseudomonadota bacterium]
MAVDRWNPASFWSLDGVPMHHAVAVHDGVTIHLSGQVGWDSKNNLIGPGDVRAQTEKTFDNIEVILGSVGGVLDDLVSLTYYYVNPSDVAAIREVRAKRLSAEHGPASAGIRCAGLILPELLVEIVSIAVVPRDRYRPPNQ